LVAGQKAWGQIRGRWVAKKETIGWDEECG
jgi:hypothetical protein